MFRALAALAVVLALGVSCGLAPPARLSAPQARRFGKAEARLGDRMVVVDGNNLRAALGWTRNTSETQALVDAWAVGTGRTACVAWDYGDAFCARATTGGCAVVGGVDTRWSRWLLVP